MKGKYTFLLSQTSANRTFFSLHSKPIIYNKSIFSYVIQNIALIQIFASFLSEQTGRSSPTGRVCGPSFLYLGGVLVFFSNFLVKASKIGQLEVFSLFKINFRTQLSINLTAFIYQPFLKLNPVHV